MTALVGVIGTLLGVILGGWFAFANARRQQQHQDVREKRRLVLSKIEELFLVLEKHRTLISRDVSLINGQHIAETRGETDSELYFEKTSTDDEIPSREKTDMLVLFYVPDVVEDYAKFVNTFDVSRRLVLGVLLAYKDNSDDQEKADIRVEMNIKWNEFLDASNAIRAKIIKLARIHL